MGNWLYNSLLKQWCEDNRVIYKEEKDMTYGTRVMIKRICDELMKWCEERHVMCEFATTDDEGLSATFIVGGTTLSVSHIELRDPEEFSRYVKNVLFGIDESKDIPVGTESLCSRIEWLEQELAKKDEELGHLDGKLKEAVDKRVYVNSENIVLRAKVNDLNNVIEDRDAYIGRLEREDKEKAKDIEYLENKVNGLENEIKRLKSNGRILYLEECIENRDKTVKKLSEDNVSLSNQLEMKRTKISELEQELEEKEKNLNRAADRIIQLKCVNTSLKEQVDILKCSLNNSCENYDLQVTKRMKAEGEIENLKKQLNDIIVTKTKTIDEDITIIENLKRENVSLKKENATLQYRVDALQNDRKDLLSGYKKDLDNLNNEIKRLKQQIM